MIDQSNIHCKPLFQHFIKICIRVLCEKISIIEVLVYSILYHSILEFEVTVKDQVEHIFKHWDES